MAIRNIANLNSKIESDDGEKIELSLSSNINITNNIGTDITVTKTSEKSWIIPKGKLLITTTITNNLDVNLVDPTIKDTLSKGVSFVPNSVKIGSLSREDLDPISGFKLDATIQAQGGEFTMTYEIEADEYIDVNSVENITSLGANVDSKDFTVLSNELSVKVLNNDVLLLKTANTSAVKSGDILTYTITITNSGTLKNTELFFSDPIPEGTTFVSDSVTINGQEQAGFNPTTGFNLPDLDANETITVTFKVNIS